MAVNLLYNTVPGHCRLNIPLIEQRCRRLLELLDRTDKDVSILFIDDPAMAEYNHTYRNRNEATNVLSFPAEQPQDGPAAQLLKRELGDVLISVETARREAQQADKTLHHRLTELIIHGLLHLMGYDHERTTREAMVMWELEQKLFHDLTQPRRTTMPQLAINVDHVATMRQARGINEPDPVIAAGICELAGARGIVVHLREDRRHIQDRDVRLLRKTVKTKLNLEMAAAKEIIDIALDIKPDMITLVPEKRKELTTEGGLDVVGNEKKLKKTINRMRKADIPVSIFIDPDATQIEAALEIGATFVELHTGRYCDATTDKERDREFRFIEQAAELAFESGLRVNAGHGLDYRTTGRIASLPTIEELSIGHAVITRAIYVGLDQAVREMLDCMVMPL
jgi:pyridoxine 5-phosphate synthase